METPVQKGIPALYRKRALLWFSFLLLKRKSAASVGLWRCPSCLPHGGKDFIDGLGGEVIFFRQFVHGNRMERYLNAVQSLRESVASPQARFRSALRGI